MPRLMVGLSRVACLVLVAAVISLQAADPVLTFSTLAGGHQDYYSVVDGVGNGARFKDPVELAIDTAGNVYISEPGAGVIRKITPGREVTTFAGSPNEQGFADGMGSAARFYAPRGLAVDSLGNVYVADTCAIRKISPERMVTTVAGDGIAGYVDGVGKTARFNFPQGIALDAAGYLYIVDGGNSAVRLMSPSGKVTTLAANLNAPAWVVVDDAGIVYVGNQDRTISRIEGGAVTTLAGSPGQSGSTDGVGRAARFGMLGGMALDRSGNLYVTDMGVYGLRKITPEGVVSTPAIAAQNDWPPDVTAVMWSPAGLAIDAAGQFYAVDSARKLVRTTAAPVFTTQPISQTVVTTESVTLSVVVSWTGASYQWQRDGINLAGANAASFTIDHMSAALAGSYTVEVSNGSAMVRSDVATLTLSTSLYPTRYAFRTLSGQAGVAGSVGGTAAKFNGLSGLGFDSAGNAYVADTANHTLRRITPTGTVTTLAGLAGTAGSADGTGNAARFNQPGALAVDGAGNIYVIDAGSTVRKITPAGAVTTLAGTAGVLGNADGTGPAARFSNPGGIAVDRAGALYVADGANKAVRKISPAGAVTTLASAVGYFGPNGVAVDAQGNVYIADGSGGAIRKISPAGAMSILAGTGNGQPGDADGTGQAAAFYGPGAIVLDPKGALYVSDLAGTKIRRVALDGTVTTFARSRGDFLGYSDGPLGTAQFNSILGIAVDPTGAIYVTDSIWSVVRKISSDGMVSTFAGQIGFVGSADSTGPADLFNGPTGVAVDSGGNVYVADPFNATLRKISPTGATTLLGGQVLQSNGAAAVSEYLLDSPFGVAVGPAGEIYVADTGNAMIRKLGQPGRFVAVAGTAGIQWEKDGAGLSASFNMPVGVAADAQGNLYVADLGGRAVRKISATGAVTTLAAGFFAAEGVAADGAGNVYVADADKNAIIKISPAGAVTTLAGSGSLDARGSNDGVGSAARFNNPMAVAVDAFGNVFVADAGNQTIRKVTPDGTVTTLAGLAGTSGSADGVGPGVRFLKPSGIAVGADGTLYVADTGNRTVRMGRAVAAEASATRLVNIATRAFCSVGNRVTIGGFVVSGSASKRVLVRAVGPTLTAQGIGAGEVLSDPMVEVHDAIHGNTVVVANDDWGASANAAEITSVAAGVGATPLLAADTRSSAVLVTLAPGVYSFVVTGKGASSGIVLLEVYDVDAGANNSSFVNIASRAYSTSGNGVTIGGFVLSGSSPKQVLLRAVGPTLASQGLGGSEVLTDPVIELHDAIHGNAVIASNDNWNDGGAGAALAAVGARVGAIPFDGSDGKSAGLLVRLLPGVYSFVASGKASSGVVLVEVYDAD